jgi:hypothetical protein
MAFKGWDRIEIETEQGRREHAIAPVIVSASRSTDIPAFYAKWFRNRFEQKYCKWINPFNRKAQYVSFDKTRFVVFWSKNPAPMAEYFPLLDEKGIGWYIQFTVNDYKKEGFEPNVPGLDQRLETFATLSEKWGKERIIWRFDPLILTDELGPEQLLERIAYIGERIHRYTEKLVISFADISNYAKVKRNLKKFNVNWREFKQRHIEQIARGVDDLCQSWNLEGATCGEVVDLSQYGISHNRCIDDELIMKISGSDRDMAAFLSHEQGTLFPQKKHSLKDKGQRKECGCIVSKDIGQYNTCEHLCAYCYANTSSTVVQKNRKLVSAESETIILE